MPEHVDDPIPEHVPGLRIRRYRPDDDRAVHGLERTGHLHISPASARPQPERSPTINHGEPEALWVAELGQQVIGTVGVERVAADIAHLHHLRVESGLRRYGIARRLVATAPRYAKELGCLKLLLQAEILTDRAIKVLDRLGFQYVGDRHEGDQRLLQFYLDLYRRPDERHQAPSDYPPTE